MERVLRWLRMLGTTGAVANARALADQRQAEQSTIDALTARLAITDVRPAAA